MKKNRSFLSSYGAKAALALLMIVSVSGCVNTAREGSTDQAFIKHSLVCENAKRLQAQVVGDGHCVSLIKACSDAPPTQQWRQGRAVYTSRKKSIKPGTVIATFLNGRYPNKTGWHAAIYIEHNADGIWVWDQWLGKPVHKRLIRYRNDGATAGNTAQEYRVVEVRN